MDLTLPEPLESLMEGIEKRAVCNFFGAPGTGKTNLCLIAMIACVNNGGRVTYIDTEGGFSFKRLEQLMPSYKLVLERINLLEPKNLKEQGDIIRNLEKSDLVIVDSLSALYRLEYAENNKENSGNKREEKANIVEANRELSKQLSVLSAFAREHDIPVIVTSHTFKNWDSGADEIVGGDAVRYWSKGIIFIEKAGKPGERKATVVKHRSVPEGKSVKFLLCQDGIKPSGFKLF